MKKLIIIALIVVILAIAGCEPIAEEKVEKQYGDQCESNEECVDKNNICFEGECILESQMLFR